MPSAYDNWPDWMNRFMFPSFFERQLSTGTIAPVDVCERNGEFVIRMGCAGCRPEDIDITVQEDTVRIRGQFMDHDATNMGNAQGMRTQMGTQSGNQPSAQSMGSSGSTAAQGTMNQPSQMNQPGQQGGSRPNQEEGTGERCLIRELPSGRFERDITLPMGVNAQQASANYEHGLLTLTLPKSQAAMGQRIHIGKGSQSSTSSNVGVTGR
jgi:HSP20 family molecular chaperone IbpA